MQVTCRRCGYKNMCKKLCKNMERQLENGKNKNKIYADNTHLNKRISYNDAYQNIIYAYGLSEEEEKKVRRIIVSILSKEQKEVLSMYAKGYNQKTIAKKLNTTQANISYKLKTIKKDIKEGLVLTIEKALDL